MKAIPVGVAFVVYDVLSSRCATSTAQRCSPFESLLTNPFFFNASPIRMMEPGLRLRLQAESLETSEMICEEVRIPVAYPKRMI